MDARTHTKTQAVAMGICFKVLKQLQSDGFFLVSAAFSLLSENIQPAKERERKGEREWDERTCFIGFQLSMM